MAFGRLTTKWRIFRSDLVSEHGIEKNCQIIRVGMKLHNYVINCDRLNFRNVPDSDLETLEYEPLLDGPAGNVGYLPTPFEDLIEVAADATDADRRNAIVEGVKERGLERPDRNIERNS